MCGYSSNFFLSVLVTVLLLLRDTLIKAITKKSFNWGLIVSEDESMIMMAGNMAAARQPGMALEQ